MAANINQHVTSQTISYIEQSDEEKQRLQEDVKFLLHLLQMISGDETHRCNKCSRYIVDQWKLDDSPFVNRALIECFGCRQQWCWGCVKTKQVHVLKVDPRWSTEWDDTHTFKPMRYCTGVSISDDNDTYEPICGDDVAFSCERCMNYINANGKVDWTHVPLFKD